MKAFFKDRGISLALIVLFIYFAALMQDAVTYTLVLGQLNNWLWHDVDLAAVAGTSLRSALVFLMTALWLFRRKRALFRVIVIANALFTAALLIHAGLLMEVRTGLSSHAVGELIIDVALMAAVNILTFSIWYWIIDPPGVIEDEPDPRPWAFLFPQRGSALPGYESWNPRYADYLFVAFSTTLHSGSPASQVPRFPDGQPRHRPGALELRSFRSSAGQPISGQNGARWSAGDTRNSMKIIELEVVARDGPIREANQDSAAARRARIGPGRSESIEPSTRGFSGQQSARFGASKRKTGKGFPHGRPNRPPRPSLYRTGNAGRRLDFGAHLRGQRLSGISTELFPNLAASGTPQLNPMRRIAEV